MVCLVPADPVVVHGARGIGQVLVGEQVRDVVGGAIKQDGPVDDGERLSVFPEAFGVGGDQRGQVCTGGVSHDDDAFRVTAVRGDVVMDPGDGLGDILYVCRVLDAGESR